MPVATRFRHKAQLLLCDGCCCGKTALGHAEVPVTFLQLEWTRRRLVKDLHLTPCHCLGPCDAANVACVLSADSAAWFGGLTSRDDYAALLDWTEQLIKTGEPGALPERLRGKRLERFTDVAERTEPHDYD